MRTVKSLQLTVKLFAIGMTLSAQEVDREYSLSGKDFHDEEDHLELSGIALGGASNGLIVPDEGRRIYPIEINREKRQIIIKEGIKLTNAEGELDLEAVAAGSGKYFVVGSHGVSRKSRKYRPGQFCLWRINAEPDGEVTADPKIFRGTLSDLLAANRELGPYYRKPLQENGINIEGLAYDSDSKMLYAGFRAPHEAGMAYILKVPETVVFGDLPSMSCKLHCVDVGKGFGIRDMAKIGQGFLLLVGNSAPDDGSTFDPEREYRILIWRGAGTQVKQLAVVKRPAEKAKPEAILVLEEKNDSVKVLVLSDGAENGRPAMVQLSLAGD